MRKAALTQRWEVLQRAACMLCEHALSLYLGRQRVIILTPIPLMWLLVFFNTAEWGRRQRLPGSPLQCSYPSWNLKHWGLLGLLQASATGQELWHDGEVQSAAQATRVYFDMLPVYLLLCIPSRVLTENGYSSAVYFLQKMLGT